MTTRATLSLLCLLALFPVTGAAQQFDTFDEDGTLEGFELDGDGVVLEEVPSLSDENGGLTSGPEITLELTEGQSGVSLTLPGTSTPVTSVSQPETETAPRLTLRALDKTLGRPTDVDLAVGETVIFGRIAINAIECRYPATNPNSDAFAHIEILDLEGNSLFDGWMIASSPALSALEHPRYDVWILRCSDGQE